MVWKMIRQQRVETTDRAILLWIRWLFFIVLSFLFLYTYAEDSSPTQLGLKAALLGFYAVSNALLMWATRTTFSMERWSMPIFLADVSLVSGSLYYTTGPDTDLYVMCFMMIYLATLGRRVRDAIPLTLVVCFIYGLLLFHKNPMVNLLDPRILLRFPFFLILALFTSYLSEQAEQHRRRIEQMREIQAALSRELQKAMVDLRNKQTALIHAEKLTAMGNMAGALAHEIRNPLSVITGYVDELLSNQTNDEWVKPLEAIRRSAQRCYDLMQNLLTFARRPKEIEMFKMKDALQETLTLVRVSAKMTQVQCNLDIRADPVMSAKRGEVQQVFINLMSNAVDAMEQGGTLTIILEEEFKAGQNWIKVSVQDTGSGIPPEVRDHLFEPFFTTKKVGKGTGLGLSIVQDIVRSYQGLLEVHSEPHQGTTFIVRLPVANPAAMPAATEGAEAAAASEQAAA
jgi:signal transduction histidine kinase